MKIGIVIDNVYQVGGVERVASLLCRMFSENLQHEVTLFSTFTRPGEGLPAFKYSDQIRIVHLSENIDKNSWLVTNSFSQKTFLKYAVLSQLKKQLKNHPQDILISTVCWCNCFLPFFKGKAKNIACEHVSFEAIPLLYRWASRLFFRFSDAAVFLTQGNAEKYTFMPAEKRFVIPNALSFMPEKSSDCTAKRIISLTRFSHEKGNDILLEIAARLKNLIPDWHIDVFGAGSEEAELKKHAQKLNLDDFLTFNAPTANAAEELLTSSIYLLYSRSEGLPMALLEAQSCGLPAVSFACGYGPGAIITNNVDGFLIAPGNIDDYVQAVVTLAHDDELRKKFGATARLNSQRFTPERIAAMWKDLFEKLS